MLEHVFERGSFAIDVWCDHQGYDACIMQSDSILFRHVVVGQRAPFSDEHDSRSFSPGSDCEPCVRTVSSEATCFREKNLIVRPVAGLPANDFLQETSCGESEGATFKVHRSGST